MNGFRRWICGTTLVLLMVMASGCESNIVTDAARQSVASFLNSVFNTTVNNALVNTG